MAPRAGDARQGSLGASAQSALQPQEESRQRGAAEAGRLVAELDVRTRRIMSVAMQGRVDVLQGHAAKVLTAERGEESACLVSSSSVPFMPLHCDFPDCLKLF